MIEKKHFFCLIPLIQGRFSAILLHAPAKTKHAPTISIYNAAYYINDTASHLKTHVKFVFLQSLWVSGHPHCLKNLQTVKTDTSE